MKLAIYNHKSATHGNFPTAFGNGKERIYILYMVILCGRNLYCLAAMQALLQKNNNEFSDPIYCWAADSWDVE